MMLPQDRWQELSRNFKEYFSVDYTAEQLANADWCCKKLAELGYSLSILYITRKYAEHVYNKPMPDNLPEGYIYQLWGPLYPERGKHASPIIPDFSIAVVTALYNVLRQIKLAKTQAEVGNDNDQKKN